jgi:hypothetical protein
VNKTHTLIAFLATLGAVVFFAAKGLTAPAAISGALGAFVTGLLPGMGGPGRPPNIPPTAGLLVLCALGAPSVACSAPSKLTPTDDAQLAAFAANIAACHAQLDAGGCWTSVIAAFNATENARFDGGFDQ